jgi:hypothetical protein
VRRRTADNLAVFGALEVAKPGDVIIAIREVSGILSVGLPQNNVKQFDREPRQLHNYWWRMPSEAPKQKYSKTRVNEGRYADLPKKI